jgi:hypothetical protein
VQPGFSDAGEVACSVTEAGCQGKSSPKKTGRDLHVPRLLVWLARLSLLPLLTFWGAILVRVAADPSNHVGWSPLWGVPFLAFVAGVGLLVWLRTRDRAAGLVVLLAGASIIGLYLVDHFAVLTSYESWIARGMPPRPF